MPDEQQDGVQPRSSRRTLLLSLGAAAASGLIGAVIAEGVSRFTSPGQAVRDDHAVDQAKRELARQKAPISANAYYYDRSDDARLWLFSQPLGTEQRGRLLARGPDSYRLPDEMLRTGNGIFAILGNSPEHPNRLFTRIRLSLVGQWAEPVFVTQIRAKVSRRDQPPAGACLFHGSQGGGEPLEIGFDLDEPDSVARIRERGGADLGVAYVDRHSITLSPGEPMSIDVQAQTEQSYCEWVVELDLALGGEKRVITVDDNGQPFRSTSLADHYQDRYYMHITNGWTPDGAGPFAFRVN
ncbi:hypothetical protein [Micromonospora sp. NPDC049645]|uniref:hypothetical protein n=1 Tax=Micromonospora sp. NPDC049645 TaxID=3155508 RepID=UPI0034398FD2